MDTITLVENQVDEGQNLLERLAEAEIAVQAACWVKPVDEDRWSLYIAAPVVDEKGSATAYRDVYRVLRTIESAWITDSDIKLIGQKHPITCSVVDIVRRFPGKLPIRSRRPMLGDLPIDEVFVYAPVESFKGFAETKDRFPSAQIFTITVKDLRSAADASRTYGGKLNSTDFEGRAPETLLLMGPKGSSSEPHAKLIFVHRPEGWNTFFREDTGAWERIVYAATGKPIYESVDFSPLEAIKVN